MSWSKTSRGVLGTSYGNSAGWFSTNYFMKAFPSKYFFDGTYWAGWAKQDATPGAWTKQSHVDATWSKVGRT